MWEFPLLPEQASTVARRVDALMLFETFILIFFTLLVAGLILFFSIRYRRGTKVDRSNPVQSNLKMEMLWIGGPLALSVVIFVWSTDVFFELATPPGDAQTIYVIGKQWMWKVQHPEGKREINELHVPLGRPIKLMMTSQDVIHSFFIPAFRTKQDVLPGRYTTVWFQPTKVGKYHLFCAEYCGTDHSVMGGYVYVMEPSDYEAWLSQGQGGSRSMAEEGRDLYVQHHCSGCHEEQGTVRAPRLEGLYGKPVPIQEGDDVRFVTADDRYIRDSILLPRQEVVAGYEPVMPSYQGQIAEQDLLKIVEYIKSIGGAEAPE